MKKDTHSIDQQSFNFLSRLYIIALSTIAFAVIFSQILIRNHIKDQQSDSTIINIAGRQRMLSQKLAKEVVLLATEPRVVEKLNVVSSLKKTRRTWEISHHALQTGNDSLDLPGNNSAIVSAKFKEIDPIFNTINRASKKIVSSIESEPIRNIENYVIEINQIKQNEQAFLKLMDAIVNQYNDEATEKISRLRTLETYLMIVSLLILIGEFIFIFLPTARTIKKTLFNLLKAEKNAKQMALNADELSFIKEKSVRELKVLHRAMEDTLLTARILSNGTIIHVGNKFTKLFKGFKSDINSLFWDVLSTDKNEKLVIEELIHKFHKIGWQGEVKATNQEQINIWLELSIIPYNVFQDKSELLIIASDITEKKNAQLEIDDLKQKRFEERINQQKIISQKIIENQEKEQSRMAKDIHDGIGQMLTALKFNLESINFKDDEKTKIKIKQLKKQTSEIIQGIRTATFNLMPSELSDHGLVPALSKLTKELSKLTGKDIIFINKTNFNQRLDTLTEINIYRITQEAVNNAIKYAQSTHILLLISHSKTILSIVIDDDGVGFEHLKVSKGKGGMGLTFMKERIKYINGRFFINSQKDKGTRITFNIPLYIQSN